MVEDEIVLTHNEDSISVHEVDLHHADREDERLSDIMRLVSQ